jgi:hypothetical protein
LDGSFLEDIEAQEGRDPRDLDVVTFVASPTDLASIDAMIRPRPDLWRRFDSKRLFCVDHFLLPLCSSPEALVDNTRYWYGLFSHRRDPDRTWKGMLRVELNAGVNDDIAWQVLGAKP